MDWGIVTTLKAPESQVLAFVAFHLDAGAAHIWVHFDDPADPACDTLTALAHPRITAIRCDDAYWEENGGNRPPKHQSRQTRNAQRVYKLGGVPALAHIDVDEFLHSDCPISDALDKWPDADPQFRISPFEALHDPTLPDDIFTATTFRAPLRHGMKPAMRAKVLGDYEAILPRGVLSHFVGKCFFRTGIKGLRPRIHAAMIKGEPVAHTAFSEDIALLHFHAHDPAPWKAALPYRLTKGAYQFNKPMAAFLGDATPQEIDDFYDRVMTVTPDRLATLRELGLVREAKLGLRVKVAALTGN